MNWNALENLDQLEEVKKQAQSGPVIIFKHSTSCSISAMALNRLERSWDEEEMEGITPFYLDLLSHRDISNAIATEFGIPHQSPQVLLLTGEGCIYDASHMSISYSALKEKATSLKN